VVAVTVAALVAVFLLPAASGSAASGSAKQSAAVSTSATAGPSCGTTTDTEYATGTTAAAIGWAGNDQAVVACLSGSFVVKNNQQLYGYGVYNGSRTTWVNADGYLPALITSFSNDGGRISITNFGDKISVGGNAFVAIYSRVSVHNPGSSTITVDPQPTSNLIPLNSAPLTVRPHQTVNHDYVVASDEFGGTYAYLRQGIQPRCGGHPRQHAHARIPQRWNGERDRPAAQSPRHRRYPGAVRRRDLEVLLAMGDLPAEDR
jgi:hypothetical protein